MNVGFDLDRIFISNPPFVPEKIILWLHKGNSNDSLKYRIPGKFEQVVRIISHCPLFRQPIKENIEFMEKLVTENNHTYFLISSRFGFLKKTTEKLIKKYEIDKMFKSLHFNYANEQPHLFKSKLILKLKIDRYIDDDLSLLNFLAERNLKTKFFWLNKKISKVLNKNLTAIKRISEMFK